MNKLNWRAMRALIRKDLLVVLRSPIVLLPMIILPLILQVVLPVGFGLAANLAAESFESEAEDLESFLGTVPPAVEEQLAGVDEAGIFLIVSLVYLFGPLYLIIPMMVSSVIAADSFVGERERKTLEALLYTPLTNFEMLFAKMITAWLAAMAVALGSFLIYAVVVNAVGWPFVGRVFFPNLLWIILVLWVVPAVAAFGLTATVLISSRVKTFQEAYQLGGIVVVPIVGLVLAQVAGLVFFGPLLAFGLGLVMWVLDAVLFVIGMRTFERDTLLARL